ncbi:MAG: hypothetical protein WCI04_04130 [archaeon]
MPAREIQRNKWFGLNKLRKIAGGENPKWGITPTVVVSHPEQLNSLRFENAQRLVLRTDEKGRTYSQLNWETMPRYDLELDQTTGKIDPKKNYGTVAKLNAGRKWVRRNKTNYILHPTKERQNIAFTGQITFGRELANKLEVSFWLVKDPPANRTIHREMVGKIKVTFLLKNGALKVESSEIPTKKRPLWRAVLGLKKTQANLTNEEKILGGVREFVEKGIKERQINPNRQRTQLSFLTWKDNPTKIEFYDLQEIRNVSRPSIERKDSFNALTLPLLQRKIRHS